MQALQWNNDSYAGDAMSRHLVESVVRDVPVRLLEPTKGGMEGRSGKCPSIHDRLSEDRREMGGVGEYRCRITRTKNAMKR